jgi:hypothetical protein
MMPVCYPQLRRLSSYWLYALVNRLRHGRTPSVRSPSPFFALAWAERPGFTRDLCLAESPEPLKRRNIFAPPNFLMMA